MSISYIKHKEKSGGHKRSDGLCVPAFHKFEDAGCGLIHPHWARTDIMPVEYCVYCGLLKVKLKKKE